jgi:hypothetical protein
MKRTLTALGMLLAVSAIIAGLWVWFLTRPSLQAVLVPEARDVHVIKSGLGTWELTYRVPNSTVPWYRKVAHQLEVQGWVAHNQFAPDIYSAPYHPVPLLRFERLVRMILWEEVILEPDLRDPTRVRMHIRRALRLDWWAWLHAIEGVTEA